jgi:stress response protein SCP2
MTIAVSKGGRALLLSKNGGACNFRVALGWKTAAPGDAEMDLDVYFFIVKPTGKTHPDGSPVKKVVSEAHFVYWGSELRSEDRKTTFVDTTKINIRRGIVKKGFPASPDCGIVHMGDNLKGTADGSVAEEGFVSPDLIRPEDGDEIVIIVEINDAVRKRQTFSMVKDAFIEIFDADTEDSLTRYQLKEDFGANTSAHFGSLWLDKDTPEFEAVGEPYTKSLEDYVNLYVY